MAAKRSRDDFITFLIQYPNGQNICYGVQMAARKYADQFLIALNNVTKQTNNAKLKGLSRNSDPMFAVKKCKIFCSNAFDYCLSTL
jgi:hypothetical protein